MPIYDYDKDEIKNNLDILQVKELVAELGGDPYIQNNILMSRTICHGGDSHKLYYYDNSHLFHCFTECGESFDIFVTAMQNNFKVGRTIIEAIADGGL